MMDEDIKICTNCGGDKMKYVEQYANGQEYKCDECEESHIYPFPKEEEDENPVIAKPLTKDDRMAAIFREMKPEHIMGIVAILNPTHDQIRQMAAVVGVEVYGKNKKVEPDPVTISISGIFDKHYGKGCYMYDGTGHSRRGYHGKFQGLHIRHQDGKMCARVGDHEIVVLTNSNFSFD